MTTTARYANWKAPADDGQILIWPPPPILLEDIRQNFELLKNAHQVRVQNVPLAEVRRAQRHWIGHKSDDQPMIASGHQTELYHPGVWVKDVLTHAAVQKIGCCSYHISVDTDHPKHLDLRWPGTTIPITDDAEISSAQWSGLLSSPTPAHLQMIERELVDLSARWKFKPMSMQVIASLRRQALEPVVLSAALTNAQHELDWELGLKHHALLVSPILFSEPYLVFAHHVLSRAEQFANDYNGALAEYRSETGMTSTTRPMPDLNVKPETIEAPFWLDDLGARSRTRAQVTRSADGWMLDDFRFDPNLEGWAAAAKLAAWLRNRNLRLSPRALTLTTFLRLLVVDQFIHGIGGGRYDQVTDRLIARHFGITPPKFAVTTATLLFPGAVGKTRICLSCMAEEGHHLKHAVLGESKTNILADLDALPRRSVQRSLAFHNMHSALSSARSGHVGLRDWESRYRDAERQDRDDQVIFDRELFYAIQPRDRLVGMIEKYSAEFNK
jgi:hypothetical protein